MSCKPGLGCFSACKIMDEPKFHIYLDNGNSEIISELPTFSNESNYCVYSYISFIGIFSFMGRYFWYALG
jgi:hypothetical protein